MPKPSLRRTRWSARSASGMAPMEAIYEAARPNPSVNAVAVAHIFNLTSACGGAPVTLFR